MTPRSEPLLWLQLIGLGALPLEALLLLLLLAGSDPGRLPALERLFTWTLGALLPGLLLVRRPADPFSLLLVTTPLRARRDSQRRLAALQEAWGLKLVAAIGVAATLPLLVWCDEHAALAAAWSPLSGSPRLVALLLAALLLALIVWQWQQASQSLWLLSRSADVLAGATPLSATAIEERRLCLGLPLLLPDPLQGLEPSPDPPAPVSEPSVPAASQPAEPTTPPDQPAPADEPGAPSPGVPEPGAPEPGVPESGAPEPEPASGQAETAVAGEEADAAFDTTAGVDVAAAEGTVDESAEAESAAPAAAADTSETSELDACQPELPEADQPPEAPAEPAPPQD